MPHEEPERPFVAVLVERGLDEARLEVEAGLEEEGIPWASRWIEPGRVRKDAAFAAATESRLGVGLVVDAYGACLHMSRLPSGEPMLDREGGGAQLWRLFGHDAARLVKGMPLLTPDEGRNPR